MKNEKENSSKKLYYKLLQKEITKSFNDIISNEFNKKFSLTLDKFIPSKKNKKIKIKGKNVDWKSYLLNELSKGSDKSWKSRLYNFILNDYDDEKKQFEKYISDNEIFYKNFSLEFFPQKILIDSKNKDEPIFSLFSGQEQLKEYAESSKKKKKKRKKTNKNKGNNELELIDFESEKKENFLNNNNNKNKSYRHLSYIDNNENKTSIYINEESDEKIRGKYYSYQIQKHISIIRMQLEKENHPIILIINCFSKFYSNRLKDFLEAYSKNDYKEENSVNDENFENTCEIVNIKDINKMKKNVIKEIQNFIEIIGVALKLFYYKAINYDSFVYERDEFINLICFFLFKKKEFYNNLFELFEKSNKEKQEKLNDKKEELRDITPRDVGISRKFRLNEDTKKLKEKKNYKEEDIIYTNNDDDSTRINTIKINEEVSHNIGIKEYFKRLNKDDNKQKKKQSLSFDKKNKISLEDFENENSGKENSENETEISGKEKNNNKKKRCLTITNYQEFSDAYNSLNTTLKEQLKEDMDNNPADIEFPNIEESEFDLNHPYKEAIKYIEKIKEFKAPLDKLTVIALVSVLITDYVDHFWKGENIKQDNFLRIDSDELLSIYLYIICKMNTESIYTQLDFIQYFTGIASKQSMIGYFYTTVEGCLKYIMQAESKKDLAKNEN